MKARTLSVAMLAALPLATLIFAGSPAQGATAKKAPLQGTAPYATQKPIRPLIPITVSYGSQGADYVYLFTAIDDGMFAREGLAVNPILLQSAPGISAIIGGSAKFALLGGADTLAAVAGGATNLKEIGVADTFSAERLWTSPSITSTSQLSGVTFASTSAAAANTVIAKMMMARFGITNFKFVYLSSVTNDVAALLSGAAQATLANPPADLKLGAAGFHMLFDLSKAHIKVAQSAVIATSQEIQQQPGLVQRFMTALTAAQKQIHLVAKKDLLADRTVLEQVTAGAVTPGQAGTTMQFERGVQSGNMTPEVADLVQVQKYAAEATPAIANINLNTFVDSQFAKAALKAVYGDHPPSLK